MAKNEKATTKKSVNRTPFSRLQLGLLVICLIVIGLVIYKYSTTGYSNSDRSSKSSNNYSTNTDNANQTNTGLSSKKTKPPAAPTIYISPVSQSYLHGSTFKISVRENSGTGTTNAIQANIAYPAKQLTLISQDYSLSAFPIDAQSKTENGKIMIARGRIGRLSGDQLVATLTFKAGPNTATVDLAFIKGTALVSASDNHNLITSLSMTGGAVYKIF